MRKRSIALPSVAIALIIASPLGTAQAGWEVRSTHMDILLGIDFVTEDTGWAAGALDGLGPVIKRTDDGGVSWTYQSTDLVNMWWLDIDFASIDKGWANSLVAFIGRQSVAGTEDGGTTWNEEVGQYGIAAWLDMFALDEKYAWSSGFWMRLLREHEGLLRTTDGGQSWSAHDWNKPEAARFVHFVDEKHGWMSGGHWPSSSVAAGGISWKPTRNFPIAIPLPAELQGRPQAEADDYGCLIGRTSDGGQTFETVFTSNQYYPNHIEFVNRNEGWFVAEGEVNTSIMHTTDGGSTWTKQPHPLEADLVSLTDVHMFNRREGWVLGWGGGPLGNPRLRFMHTFDGGESWQADPFETNIGPLHMSWVDESSGFTVGGNNFNVTKVVAYDEPARNPKMRLTVVASPETAGGSDTIEWDLLVENLTGSEQSFDAWLQGTGPTIPGYAADVELATGLMVPPNYQGVHRVTFSLPGVPVGLYAVETILGPTGVADPLQIAAYATFSIEITSP